MVSVLINSFGFIWGGATMPKGSVSLPEVSFGGSKHLPNFL